MDNFLRNSFPEYIKKEIEAIQNLILPVARKTSKYMLWTFPLLTISLVNLVYLLAFTPKTEDTVGSLVLFAILGALGMALWKETKLNKKEIEKIGLVYIVDRIQKSRVVSEDRKNYYLKKVKEQPVEAMTNFIKFLQEENRTTRTSIQS